MSLTLYVVSAVVGVGMARASAGTVAINSTNPLTATMDAGTNNVGSTSTSATWYAQSYNPDAPATGLPSGTVVSATNSTISYTMPSFVSGNDALLLTGSSTGNISSGTINFASPVSAATTNFSFLTSTGSGTGTLTLTLNLVGGGTFSVTPTVTSPDWFGNTPIAINANGRVNPTNFDAVNSGNPRLYDETVSTGYAGTAAISGISIAFSGSSSNSNTAIFAVSGSTDGTTYSPIALNTNSFNQSLVAIPEPAAFGLLGLAGTALLARRRRQRL